MTQLNDEVRSVVDGFVKNGELFTALDVSNKVKMAMPTARHSEVRDVVRNLFTTDLEPNGWAHTPIQVELTNGQKATALLYHPLSDSWDLDRKYDVQKRAQAAIRPVASTTQLPQAVAGATSTNQFGWCGTPPPVPQVVVAPVATAPVAAPAKALPTRALWDQLFNSQPSLFPRK
jgi:hypothetical protein